MEVENLEFYYCLKCEVIHYKHRKTDGSIIKIFQTHSKYGEKVSDTFRRNYIFKKSWKRLANELKK